MVQVKRPKFTKRTHRLVRVAMMEAYKLNIAPKMLAAMVEVSPSCLTQWRQGRQAPHIPHVEKLLSVVGYKLIAVKTSGEEETQ